MRIIADFHIHSRYARACSKNITIKALETYARMKGIAVLGTGDFTHPLWLKELKASLAQEGGMLRTQSGYPFVLQTEISNMFSQGGKGRRVHSLLLAPDFETVDQIRDVLLRRGRLDYDGRPVFGFSCIELVEMMRGVSKEIEVIPAHAWTPWFSVFGSSSGFDSLKECFGDQARHVHAIETGLSSNPAMNWRLSQLDPIQLVSFSDMHSFWPHRIGREATLFDLEEMGYRHFLEAIRTGEGLAGTIEVDPAYGKYHWDGHRNCGVVLSPQEANKGGNICPVCRRQLTIGVEHRVEQLADRPEGFKSGQAKPFHSLLPLSEIIACFIGGEVFSKKVMEDYQKAIKLFGTEFAILLDAGKEELEQALDRKIVKGILDMREGRLRIKPGYDGVYGEPFFEGAPQRERKPMEDITPRREQKTLGEFSSSI